jgi:hypothetical protein
MKIIFQLKKWGRNAYKNLAMAQMMIDVIWDCFGCDPVRFSGRSMAWWWAWQSGLWLTKSSGFDQ